MSITNFLPTVATRVRRGWNQALFPANRSDLTVAGSTWSRSRDQVALLALFVVSSALILPNVAYPLIDPDESRYVQIAIEMIQSKNWVTPTLDGQPYLDKPPLLYWLTASSIWIFGQTEWAARLPSIVSGILTVLMTFWLGRSIVGSRAAWCGATALLLCGGFVFSAHFLLMDSLLTLCTTVSLFCGYRALSRSEHATRWAFISGVGCAMGILAKGPVAAAICLPPMIAHLWLTSPEVRLRPTMILAFAIPVILMSAPWYLAITMSNAEFGGYFFWKHNIVRFTSGLNHQEPFWYYIPVLLIGAFPTSLLMPSVAVFLFSSANSLRQHRDRPTGFLLLSVAWVVIFFSISRCKLPTYILPALPGLCLLIGTMLDRAILKPHHTNRIAKFLKPFPQRSNLILLTVGAIAAGVDLWLKSAASAMPLLAISLSMIAIWGTYVTWNRPIRLATRWYTTAAIGLVVVAFAFNELVPEIATQRSIYVKAQSLTQQNQQLPIVFFDVATHAADFYLPASRIVKFSGAELAQFDLFVQRNPAAIVITRNQAAKELAIAAGKQLTTYGERGYVHFAHQEGSEEVRVAALTERAAADRYKN